MKLLKCICALALLGSVVALLPQSARHGGVEKGTFDASGTTSFIVRFGTGAPASGDCDATGERGNLYVQSGDPASVATRVSVCTQTGASSYAWNPVSHKVGTTAPATCVTGELFFDSDATAGSNWFGCTSSNTWTALGGGGIAPSTRGAYSSLPTCNSGITGQLYFLTDARSGYKHAQCNGTSWQWYITGTPITLPGAAASWTSVGNFTTSPTDAVGGIYWDGSSVTNTIPNGLLKAVPGSTPYRLVFGITAYTVNASGVGSDYSSCGLMISNGTNWADAGSAHKKFTIEMQNDSPAGPNSWLAYYTDRDSFSSQTNRTFPHRYGDGPVQMIAYRDDGTNRFFEYFNGIAWMTVFSEGRTTDFTATHAGVYCSGPTVWSMALHHHAVE